MSQAGEEDSGGRGSNAGSQYALCALGVGLLALGVVMIVWSVADVDGGGGASGGRPDQGRTSSVAFVLVGAGVTMLLLSLCLGLRNKQRRAAAQDATHTHTHTRSTPPQPAQDTVEVLEERFTVPSYEEVVGGAVFPAAPPAGRTSSSSQLPTYEDVLEGGQGGGAAAAPEPATGGRWNSRAAAARKLLPLKIRRITSEKLRVKSASSSPQPTTAVFSIEPLTPPPQYDDEPPQL